VDSQEDFEQQDRAPSAAPAGGLLVVDLEGYEGPLDVLLALARDQKVDLKHLSILALAEQYLHFITEARHLRLELAADYLVMAAWLAYLKSRLLLPEPDGDDEPTGEELAARLAFQLQRLEAMREAAARLMARERQGIDVFPRGCPEGVTVIRNSVYQLSLYELLKGYAEQEERKGIAEPLRMRRDAIFTIEEAAERLEKILGHMPDWAVLQSFLPADISDPFASRSATASTLVASLEMAKQGKLQIRQGQAFGPIYLRRGTNRESAQ
jgi:segregation and condensation protein A